MIPLLESIVAYSLGNHWIEPECWRLRNMSNEYYEVYIGTFREPEMDFNLAVRDNYFGIAKYMSRKFEGCKGRRNESIQRSKVDR